MSDSHEQYRYLELMHAELDREASEEQLGALKEYLASHPEAQRVHTDLAKLTDVLNQVEEVETPRDLHGSILASLPPRRRALNTGAQSIRPRFKVPLIRYGFALAAGLLLGFLFTGFALRNPAAVDRSAVSGTMSPLEGRSHYVVAEQMKLAVPGLTGLVELSRSRDNQRIIFDLDGQEVDVEVSFDASRAGLQGFSQEPNRIRSLEAKEGTISFRSTGKQRSTVILASEKHPQLSLNLRFYAGGQLIRQGTLGGEVPARSPN